jgi:transcriptional regulator with XRE-family HTH domain
MRTLEVNQSARSVSPLRVYRTARGLSQRELAYLAGVSRRQIVRLESGSSTPALKTANSLALVLAVSPEALFPPGGDGA